MYLRRVFAYRFFRYTSLFCVIVIVALGSRFIAAEEPTQTDHLITAVRRPNGWPLPPHSKVRSLVDSDKSSGHGGTIEDVAFQVERSFFIPGYYLAGSELILNDIEVQSRSLHRLACNGRVFGYYSRVSTHTGMDFEVWWIDTDGSGKYTDFLRTNHFPAVPGWVKVAGGVGDCGR
jgi:hypothetical protein